MAREQDSRRPDDPTRPPETGLPEGAGVGGIPSTMTQGIDRAGDRAASHREGGPRSGAGEADASTRRMAGESAATAPRDGRDRTQATDTTPAGTSGAKQVGQPGPGDRGQDDSVPESLGKSIAEPFKSS